MTRIPYFIDADPNDESDYYNRCDVCEINDGRPTLYWKHKDFAICHECLDKLFMKHIAPTIKRAEIVKVTRKSIPEKLRNRVYERDGFKCVKCGSSDMLVIDHIRPFCIGGKTEFGNLQTLCWECNSRKAMRNEESLAGHIENKSTA